MFDIVMFACGWNSYIVPDYPQIHLPKSEIFNWGRHCAEEYKQTGVSMGMKEYYEAMERNDSH